MIALNISDIKGFMGQLLARETFDNFLVLEAVITTANTFTIDGRLSEAFLDDLANEDKGVNAQNDGKQFRDTLQKWGNVRNICFELIKGRILPVYFKVVLQLSAENTARFLEKTMSSYKPEDIAGLYMNITFDRKELRLVTGSSVKVFSMDKSLDREWDSMVERFLRSNNIDCELI